MRKKTQWIHGRNIKRERERDLGTKKDRDRKIDWKRYRKWRYEGLREILKGVVLIVEIATKMPCGKQGTDNTD